jgi:hypothetical protein
MKLREGKTPIPQVGGEEHLGESSSEDEQAPPSRGGKGKPRKARAPGSLRITSAEKKKLQATLLRMFVKPVLYEETTLSPDQVAEVITACTVGTSEARAAVFDRKRVLAQWKLILTVTWGFDLKQIKANQVLDKAQEAAVGLGGEQAKVIRELEGKIEEDKEKLVAARAELSTLLVTAAAEIDAELDVVVNTQTASASFESLLLGFKTVCALTSGHDQELFELKEGCEKLLMTLASKMTEFRRARPTRSRLACPRRQSFARTTSVSCRVQGGKQLGGPAAPRKAAQV